jgi:divalent metal cation (Fe/Co/Zn/Cd) transporter
MSCFIIMAEGTLSFVGESDYYNSMATEKHNKTLLKKALRLEYLTIVWNIFEGAVCMIIGLMSGSVALFAYGLESSVEVFASSVVIWELKGNGRGREKMALKMIGAAYLVVSAYICYDAIKSLMDGTHPEASLIGIIFLLATVIVMIILGVLKQRVGKKMGSASVLADAKFTLIDGALSATVLVGLLTNSLFGWWWMDQALALFLAGAAFREGIKEVLD